MKHILWNISTMLLGVKLRYQSFIYIKLIKEVIRSVLKSLKMSFGIFLHENACHFTIRLYFLSSHKEKACCWFFNVDIVRRVSVISSFSSFGVYSFMVGTHIFWTPLVFHHCILSKKKWMKVIVNKIIEFWFLNW